VLAVLPHRSPRRTAVALSAALLAPLLGGLLVPSAAHAAEPAPDLAALLADDLTPTDVAALLAELPVREERGLGLPADAFGPWVDADADGCDTRSEVLLAESVADPTVDPDCTVVAGEWESP
jgi:hypothetical protein